MPIQRYLLTALAFMGLVAFSTACSDHRAEDFCTSFCECNTGGEEELLACTTECTTDITNAEIQTGDERLLSDACFSCVTTSSCQQFGNCTADCQPLFDALTNEPEDQPVPGSDPQLGDQ